MIPCKAVLLLGDDYGDNDRTIRCQLPEGHIGQHQESFGNEDSILTEVGTYSVTITWSGDDSDLLSSCDDSSDLGMEE